MAKRPRTDPVMVGCPCCKGAGKVELSGCYLETLVMLRRERREINGAALASRAGVPSTAMNNRLVRLEELGLASGRRNGRERLWSACPAT